MTGNQLLRKTFAAFMLIAAIAIAVGAVPGVIENIAYACDLDTGAGC